MRTRKHESLEAARRLIRIFLLRKERQIKKLASEFFGGEVMDNFRKFTDSNIERITKLAMINVDNLIYSFDDIMGRQEYTSEIKSRMYEFVKKLGKKRIDSYVLENPINEDLIILLKILITSLSGINEFKDESLPDGKYDSECLIPELFIKFDKITIEQNESGLTHEISNMFIVCPILNGAIINPYCNNSIQRNQTSMRGWRTKYSMQELRVGYIHSHMDVMQGKDIECNGNVVTYYSNPIYPRTFCTGNAYWETNPTPINEICHLLIKKQFDEIFNADESLVMIMFQKIKDFLKQETKSNGYIDITDINNPPSEILKLKQLVLFKNSENTAKYLFRLNKRVGNIKFQNTGIPQGCISDFAINIANLIKIGNVKTKLREYIVKNGCLYKRISYYANLGCDVHYDNMDVSTLSWKDENVELEVFDSKEECCVNTIKAPEINFLSDMYSMFTILANKYIYGANSINSLIKLN